MLGKPKQTETKNVVWFLGPKCFDTSRQKFVNTLRQKMY